MTSLRLAASLAAALAGVGALVVVILLVHDALA
jgi:hypothetical protein